VTRIATLPAILFTTQTFRYPRDFRRAVTGLPEQYTGMSAFVTGVSLIA
jgi:hypothetical protein